MLPPDPRRWARQLALPEIGPAGQSRLAASRVLVVGAGGLGSPVALWLAAAGVGELTLVDPDRVEASNLHRQLLYAATDVGRPKVEAAAERIAGLGSGTRVVARAEALDAANADPLVAGHLVAVDATDRLAPRYALSDACVRAGVPMVHGAVARFEGRVTVLAARGAPCYRCLWPDPPPAGVVPSCAEQGVLGVVPGVVGLVQATEVLKLLVGFGTPLVGRLWVSDLRDHATHRFTVAPDPLCPACGGRQIRPTNVTAPPSESSAAGSPADAVPATPPAPRSPTPTPAPARMSDADASSPIPEITPRALAERLRGPQPPVLLDVREPWEHEVARIAGARLVPLGTLPTALATLDPAQEYVLHCHHGMRSLRAAEFLRARGVPHVTNLAGGIDAWSDEVDAAVPKY